MYLNITTFCITLSFLLVLVISTKTQKPAPLTKRRFIPKKTACDLNQLCTNSTAYPKLAIKRLLKRNKKQFGYLAGSVIAPAFDFTSDLLRAPEVEENMCRTKKISMTPKVAFDIKKNRKFIVNVEDFQQIITYETCIDLGESCFGNSAIPNDFETLCKQAYTVVRLLSVTHTGKLEYSYFPVPSTCVCSYRKLNDYG
ncbi:uncharacterized protein LOC114326108 [Diabrotica virgifera virgifera]|uniref:Spaetzle domain-containing protein n=1 Tax=Diabrotica virgifera virgifera TaxID=50390 RepID=A0ABM5ID03_DIAVI|nr:uncharacterized protein LOC114326108 [Diabrotica virgifera virgifera]